MIKKIFIVSVLLFLFTQSQAQVNFIAGAGSDLYMSKYIVDDNLADIDLKDYHSLAFNFAPHLHAGIDISNRLRFLAGLATSSKIDKTDWSYLLPDSLTNANTDYSVMVKNKYFTIPLSLTVNLVDKEAKSRLPIGFTADINMLNKQEISSESLSDFNGIKFPVTYNKEDLDSVYDALSYTVGFTMGYGFKFNYNFGIDALLFAKYDLSNFDNSNSLYNHYGFVGLNLTLYYKFGKESDE